MESTTTDILLVEDDDGLGAILTAVLQDHGYRVVRAANGKEALDHLHAERPPRLILLNLMMPVMNGWKFSDYLKQDPVLAQIPVVVLSGICNLDKKVASLEAAESFTKPYNLKALLDTVRQYCPTGEKVASGS
jgi:CheY-like chemotaxis protein